MKILGLDLGTKCGWAVLDDGKHVASGTWDFSIRKHEGQGMRLLRFGQAFAEVVRRCCPDVVAYEIPFTGAMKGDASVVFGALVGQLHIACDTWSPTPLTYKGFVASAIKKLATGKGNAKKLLMEPAANERFAPYVVGDHNEADALFVALAMHQEIA